MYLTLDNLSAFINRYLNNQDFFGFKIADILLFTIFILFIFFISWLIKRPLKYALKIYLFKGRKELWKRLFFYRVDKVFRPVRYILMLYLFNISLKIFISSEVLADIFFLLYTLLFAKFLYELFKFFLYKSLNEKIKKYKGARRELFNLVLNVAKVFIGVVIILLILSRIGIDLTALVTSLGIGGVIIGFSSKEALTNFFDSIRLISEDAFRQGDWIETKDVEGFVTEIGLVATKIRTFDNALVTVPNSLLANNYVKNWTKRVIGRRIKFNIKIKITTDFKELDKVLFEIYDMLHSHPDIITNNKLKYITRFKKTYEDGIFNLEDKYGVRRTLLVYLDSIDTYCMNILIYAFSISIDWEEWLRVKQDVIKKVLLIINNSKLELAVPKEEIILENLS